MTSAEFDEYLGTGGSGVELLDDISDAGNWLGGFVVIAALVVLFAGRR
jgi:hypothetical protein